MSVSIYTRDAGFVQCSRAGKSFSVRDSSSSFTPPHLPTLRCTLIVSDFTIVGFCQRLALTSERRRPSSSQLTGAASKLIGCCARRLQLPSRKRRTFGSSDLASRRCHVAPSLPAAAAASPPARSVPQYTAGRVLLWLGTEVYFLCIRKIAFNWD